MPDTQSLREPEPVFILRGFADSVRTELLAAGSASPPLPERIVDPNPSTDPGASDTR